MPDQFLNGTDRESTEEEGRQPSYVRLARCLSGYSTLNYDPSKQVLGRSPSPMRPSQEIVESTPPPPSVDAVSTSFIEQRVERLYGPGALAQVFYSRASSSPRSCKTPQPQTTQPKMEVDNSKSVPVMKLLRPEFRAQLASASLSSPSHTPQRPHKILNNDVVDACNPVKRQLVLSQEAKDGHYFLKKLDEEVKGLQRVAVGCEAELASCTSEEGCGVLRSILGKARLLIAEKLNQFRGLCEKNIKQSDADDFPTTNEDLAGFWDMVMIQVCEVLVQFKNIEKLKKNNWCETQLECSEKSKIALRPSASNKTKATNASGRMQSEASKARDAARRKMLQDRRHAMKQQVAPNSAPATAQQPSTSLFII